MQVNNLHLSRVSGQTRCINKARLASKLFTHQLSLAVPHHRLHLAPLSLSQIHTIPKMKYSYSLLSLATLASAQEFTSIFNITASPDQVVNAMSVSTPGQPGASGQFNYAINSKTDTICYDITLFDVTGAYQSPARTATHIHQAAKGRNGPPRIAFPNPVGDDKIRRSVGCLTGPFLTGIKMADNVTDTGAGFTLSQIEANPSGFFTDSHTALFVAGVVRGQLDQKFELIEEKDEGTVITTATLTKTEDVTITKCPATVTDCPAASTPVVTKTEKVYTVCSYSPFRWNLY